MNDITAGTGERLYAAAGRASLPVRVWQEKGLLPPAEVQHYPCSRILAVRYDRDGKESDRLAVLNLDMHIEECTCAKIRKTIAAAGILREDRIYLQGTGNRSFAPAPSGGEGGWEQELAQHCVEQLADVQRSMTPVAVAEAELEGQLVSKGSSVDPASGMPRREDPCRCMAFVKEDGSALAVMIDDAVSPCIRTSFDAVRQELGDAIACYVERWGAGETVCLWSSAADTGKVPLISMRDGDISEAAIGVLLRYYASLQGTACIRFIEGCRRYREPAESIRVLRQAFS